MDTIATIASRLCRRSRLDRETKDIRSSDDAVHTKPPWHRSPRTKAAFAAKAIAMEEAIGVLEGSKVAYTQPVAGKLVVDPPPGIPAALTVTFWPAEALAASETTDPPIADSWRFRTGLGRSGTSHHWPSLPRPKSGGFCDLRVRRLNG